jgi:hypothetical protein
MTAISDRYGGRDESGWLMNLAPRLALEMPPARLGAVLSYEPTLVAYSAAASDPTWALRHQGSLALSMGVDGGNRLSASLSHQRSVESVFAEQEGLTEHVASQASLGVGLVSPERGNLGLNVYARAVQFPDPVLRQGDHTALGAEASLNARLLLRTTSGIVGRYEVRRFEDAPGGKRDVRHGFVGTSLQAQLIPHVALRIEGGPAWRWDPEPHSDLAINVAADFQVGYRVRGTLHAGTRTDDALWRRNTRVRLASAGGQVTTMIREGMDLAGGLAWVGASYPVWEQPTFTTPATERDDNTWRASGQLSFHPRETFRLATGYAHSWRSSSFPGKSWRENRWTFSAYYNF